MVHYWVILLLDLLSLINGKRKTIIAPLNKIRNYPWYIIAVITRLQNVLQRYDDIHLIYIIAIKTIQIFSFCSTINDSMGNNNIDYLHIKVIKLVDINQYQL